MNPRKTPFDEEAAIGNMWTDTIYPHDFRNGAGKYFNIITEDGNTTVEYSPPYPSRNRIKLSVTFIRGNGEIKEVTLKKFQEFKTRGVARWEEQRWGPDDPMSFTHFTFEKLLAFLKLLTELDLANLNERRIALREDGGHPLDAETRAKMSALAQHPDGANLLDQLLRNGAITSRDLVNIGYRKSQLEIFRRLLGEDGFLASYGNEQGLRDPKPEKVWQHFFGENEWIFGFGLDYRFLGILQREAHISEADLRGRDGAIADFLMGATNFTVLVELKRPDTPLFTKSQSSAGTWRLSTALIEAVSQILEQKAAWQVKAVTNASSNYAEHGEVIEQRTADPKCILIIGSDVVPTETSRERKIKQKTFELFRRDSRNIEILTYNELLERAEFIVGHATKAEVE